MLKLKYIDIFREGFPFFIADTVFSNRQPTQEHTHDFCEFFLVRQGILRHVVNGTSLLLKKGDLCYVEPIDAHYFQSMEEKVPAQITNVAFSEKEYFKAMEYLLPANIDRQPNMKTVTLNNLGKQAILAGFDSIHQRSNDERADVLLPVFRSLLIQVLLNFLSRPHSLNNDPVPGWLTYACEQMQKKENFSKGINRFIELSGKTQEHLTRSLQKYRNQSPSEWVNKVRLIEAAHLLRNHSTPVNEIGYEVGFENPSYFNRLFKQVYGQSPNQYRKANHSIVYVSE
ncbi:MAG: helix-turn-helix domain-containing protein [Prolixibacteraceae bacterium]